MTDPCVSRILEAVSNGLPFCDAARLGGIVPYTLISWRRRGRAPDAEINDPHCYDFQQRIELAQVCGEEELVKAIRRQADKDWRAAAHLLMVRSPEKYSKTNRHELAGAGGEAIDIVIKWPGADDGSDDGDRAGDGRTGDGRTGEEGSGEEGAGEDEDANGESVQSSVGRSSVGQTRDDDE